MPSKNEKKKVRKTTRKDRKTAGKITTKDIEARVIGEAKSSGKTEKEVLDEMFGDGWLTVMIEESGTAHIDASQLYVKEQAVKNTAAECKRLRNTFAPIASCVDYVKKQLLAGGIEVIIDNLKDKHQIDVKEHIMKFINNVHQDRYTRGLFTILAIMVDLALTTGVSAAEICFDLKNLDFWNYAEIDEEAKQQILIAKKKKRTTAEYILIKTKEPNWKDLKGIVRLKIANNVSNRFKLYRDPKTWEAKYWSIDEPIKKKDEIITSQGIRISLKTFRPEKPNVTYMHPWQVFWLNLNRKDYSEMSESIITEVLSSALLLEKIMKAVGEGIHRAGNKKYFIICGSEKRRWSDRYIRNMLQQLKEASQKNWSTIPAPAGFDIKDMGGEVFEAENVVAYFKKIIARGMKVPAKVLGVEVRDEPYYSYEIMKEQLRMAIKYQLFETHLWCKFGEKTRGKQGGKSTSPIYVPEVRFKDEALLSFSDRIELLFKGFNVANPFSPYTKLKAETEYCRLMGWDDVILPTQEGLKKILDEAEKEEKAKKEAKEKETVGPEGKRQGPPEPQTRERQEKRLEGATKKHPEKGKARPQGETRKPKEVQESVSVSEPPKQEVLIKVVTESKPTDIVVKTPLDDLMADLVKKQQEKVDLEKNLSEEEGKRKQKKTQTEIDKIVVEIEQLTAEIEKIKVEGEKIKAETKEVAKTQERKRKVTEEIQRQYADEKRKRELEKTGKELKKIDAEISKIETEEDEIKKTHAKKRETMKRIDKQIEREEEFVEEESGSEE